MTAPTTVYRRDYRPFTHSVDSVDLDFQLDPRSTLVTSVMRVTPRRGAADFDLVLDGRDLTLESVSLDGKPLPAERYRVSADSLTIPGLRRQATLTIVNRFSPEANTSLSGIYLSKGAFMSQCEAEGFRAITYWPDRPDVMSRFTVTIHADRESCPVLLSNGNLVASGEEENGRHWARWEDPFKKPCYLFALVAGALRDRSEKFTLKNGRECLLQVWTEPRNYEHSAWALESLKKAIRWDEERWGLELDLERFMVVATDDFNFGAMENKGLNVFNSRYVMASPDIATDADHASIESVIGHEYFHNWTGDRVTLRDWFQLTLKEGLTVFRDQEFTMDLAPDAATRALKRIRDVKLLRATQFREDGGPMSHPIRPESYREINNFYTTTVYDKGAEVIRMLQTMLGRDGFRRGMDLYISRHDGGAVTCDDFIAAMAEANQTDLTHFSLWWSQSGTPRVTVETKYDQERQTLLLRARQSNPPTADQSRKAPLVIPIAVSLLDTDCRDMPLRLSSDAADAAAPTTRVLLLESDYDEWRFTGVQCPPVLSLGRDFSAPVIFDYAYTRQELSLLARRDSDHFNRYEAMRRLTMACLNDVVDQLEAGEETTVDETWLDTFRDLLGDETTAPAFRAVALTLPEETEIAQTRAMINPDTIRAARAFVRSTVGQRFGAELNKAILSAFSPRAYSPEPAEAGKRALRNVALDYWMAGGNPRAVITASDQFKRADNLTDRLASLTMFANSQSPARSGLLERAARQWYQEPLLINKWFTVQATATARLDQVPTLRVVRELMESNVFSLSNPNNVFALVGAFCQRNLAEFHSPDGAGYRFWLDTVRALDKINGHVAARLARALDDWRRFEPGRARMMRQALVELAATEGLSSGTREIVDKSLNAH